MPIPTDRKFVTRHQGFPIFESAEYPGQFFWQEGDAETLGDIKDDIEAFNNHPIHNH